MAEQVTDLVCVWEADSWMALRKGDTMVKEEEAKGQKGKREEQKTSKKTAAYLKKGPRNK